MFHHIFDGVARYLTNHLRSKSEMLEITHVQTNNKSAGDLQAVVANQRATSSRTMSYLHPLEGAEHHAAFRRRSELVPGRAFWVIFKQQCRQTHIFGNNPSTHCSILCPVHGWLSYPYLSPPINRSARWWGVGTITDAVEV